MGCASSAALPFLTNKTNQGVSNSAKMNGNPPYELKMVNNKLKENGIGNVKDVNESYVTDKMKEVVDSTVVQGGIGGVVQAKDEVISQIKALGEKVTEAVDDVEEAMESAFGKLTNTAEENLKSEVPSIVGENEKPGEIKTEDIDELLSSLPTEEEVAEAVKATAEEVMEKATDELKEEEKEEVEK